MAYIFKFGKKSSQILNNPDLSHDMRKVCKFALKESDVDFSLIRGFSTAVEQNKIYKENNSFADGFVIISEHQNGNAVDVLPYIKDEDGNVINCWNYDDERVKLAYQEVHRAFLRAGRILGLNIELGVTYIMKNGDYDWSHIQINPKA